MGGIDPEDGTPIGSGNFTTTSNGSSNNVAIQGTCYASASNGSISGSGSLTWHFKWYPDSGKTYSEDPPVDEIWEFHYGIGASVGNYGASQSVSCSSSLTVGSHTVSASGSYTPGSYGMMGWVPGHFDGSPSSQSEAAVIEEELTGETIAITHSVSASGSAGQGVGATITLNNSTVNPKDNEAIWHLHPALNSFHASGVQMSVDGKWRGFQNVGYAIRQSITPPPGYPDGLDYFAPANREFGIVATGTGVQGSGRDISWTGHPVKPDYGLTQQGSPWQSNVRLWKWNAATQQYDIDTGKHHEQPFKVTP